MNAFAAFVIGLLVGWVVEWIIDWVYWRRNRPAAQPEGLAECRGRVAELEQEIASYKTQLASLQAEAARTAAPVEQPVERAIDGPVRAASPTELAAPLKPDDLEVIVGIGPVIARTLNNAGIHTFAELAALTPEDLRKIVGQRIERLADEEKILSQARQLADEKNRGG